jgi:hypothetical protein
MMMDKWPETPVSRKIIAELRDGTRVEYKELKIGDVFRPVRMICDSYFNFETGQFDDNFWCKAMEAPQPSGSGEGYGLEVLTGTKDDIDGKASD